MAKKIVITKNETAKTGELAELIRITQQLRRALEEIQTELQRLENNKQDA